MVETPSNERRTVYILGTGRMGKIVARSLASQVDLVLVGRDAARLEGLAGELGARTASLESAFEGADAVVLALPGEVTVEVLERIAPQISGSAVVINIATAVMRRDLIHLVPGDRLAAAKFVGQYFDMEAGGQALVVVEAGSPEVEGLVTSIMSHCGPVVRGSEQWVLIANRVAAEEGVRAALNIRRRLEAAGIPESLTELAVSGVACGCMKAFVVGSLGPFGQVIADRIKAEQGRPSPPSEARSPLATELPTPARPPAGAGS